MHWKQWKKYTQSETITKDKQPSAASLDYYHVPEGHWQFFRSRPTKYDKIKDRQFEKINVISHRLSLYKEARPAKQRSYRTRLKDQKVVIRVVKRERQANNI